MEIGEKDQKKVQGQIPWIPTTPFKPIVQSPVPIYTTGERVQLGSTSLPATNINARNNYFWPGHGAAVTNIVDYGATTHGRLSFDHFPSSNNSFVELLAQTQAPFTHMNATHARCFNNHHFAPVLSSQFNPGHISFGHSELSYGQPLFSAIHHNYQDPPGSSYYDYYGKTTTSDVDIPVPNNVVRTENTQNTGIQQLADEKDQCVEEKDQCREEKLIPNEEKNISETSHKEPYDSTAKFAAVSTPAKENHNHEEISHHVDLNKTPQQKLRRRKHRPKVIKEDKPGINVKQATPKPVQSEGNPTGKRKYTRRKGLNKTSPQTEATGEATKPLKPRSAKKTCRTSLNFEIREGQDGTSVPEALNNEERQAAWAKPHANSVETGNKGLQAIDSKRKHSSTLEHDTNNINLTGTQYNTLQAHCPEFWVQFPNLQKKRRSEKGRNSNTCNTSSMSATNDIQVVTCPREDPTTSPHASCSKFWTYGSDNDSLRVPVTITATDSAIHDKPQLFGSSLSLGQTQTKRRSKVPNRKTCLDAEKQPACVDTLVAETSATVTKKKRTKKRSTLVCSAYSCTSEMQQNQKVVLGNHSLPLDNSFAMDAEGACEETWKNSDATFALIEQFRHLSINREIGELVLHGRHALAPYNQKNQKHKGLADGCGTIIPYEGSFDPIKKQHPRPKVELDEETTRVWKLLMLDINSHGIDGMDEDKAKRWEEERNVFRGRADSFIARMHLVQGDRRFSPWKGSVVDSVIGVFLTQNVSDHLSSSAFMSLAARFPLKSNSNKTCHEERAGLRLNIVEPEESTRLEKKLLDPSADDLSSMTVDVIEHSEEKEAVDSNDSNRTSGNKTSGSLTSLTDELKFKMPDSTQRHMKEQHCPKESGPVRAIAGEGQENSCNGGARKELNDMVSSQCSASTSQTHADFSVDQSPEKIHSCSESSSDVEDLSNAAKYNIFYDRTSFSRLLEMASSTTLHEVSSQRSKSTGIVGDVHGQPTGMLEKLDVTQDSLENEYPLKMIPENRVSEINCYDLFKVEGSSGDSSKHKDENDMKRPGFPTTESETQATIAPSQSMLPHGHLQQQSNHGHGQQNASHISGQTQDLKQKKRESDPGDQKNAFDENGKIEFSPTKVKSRDRQKGKKDNFDWDFLRIEAQAKAGKREKTENTMDSLDWDAVRRADVKEIADAIKERGMNNMLAERIKSFLNLLVDKHGAIDLEWLRDVPPDQAKEYLLSIRGLGLKSVECVRLLTLHHLAFPVDTNVGRIAVRLGWVPLQPLPESLQLHLLELYPVLESIQKYLWPRLCKLDQRTLYELHYQLITFGKVFCTKHKPNCNACPMRGECRHFASAFASARLALPGPEQKNIVITNRKNATDQIPSVIIHQKPLPLPAYTSQAEELQQTEVSKQLEAKSEINICQPIIEEPATPEPECSQLLESDIEDAFCEELGEIPPIPIDMEELSLNVQNIMEENMELQEGEMSKALVALTAEAACIPTPKLKNVSRLRTEHWVYELPDSHRLLEGWDKRETDDPGKYLLAIWTPGETADSTQPPETKCSSQDCGQLCNQKECFSCNSVREANSQIVRGTILIPCRTAMRGSFPLNGTYFQVNEVFADQETSLNPIHVPRSWIWNLRRRTVYFGTSIPTIFKGLTTQEIQRCFWRGFVCVRGYDRQRRAPRPLRARLHYPASKLAKKESAPARPPQALNQNLQANPEQPELLANIPINEKQGP